MDNTKKEKYNQKLYNAQLINYLYYFIHKEQKSCEKLALYHSF